MSENLTSLTSPADRGDGKINREWLRAEPLTKDELTEATKALVDTNITDKFPRLERTYADPPVNLQTYGLVSFIPAKGATPDKDGVFGMMKLRGNYATPQEAYERTDMLIRNHDSYHKIYTTYVGRPFPITVSDRFSAEKSEIDIRKKVTEVISEDIKAKKAEEKKEIEDMQRREKELVDQTKPDHVADPLEEYTVLRVKKAQLTWTYLETAKKMEDMKNSIIKVREEVAKIDAETPEYKEKYYEKYAEARRSAGIEEAKTQESFMKYMVEDVELGF